MSRAHWDDLLYTARGRTPSTNAIRSVGACVLAVLGVAWSAACGSEDEGPSAAGTDPSTDAGSPTRIGNTSGGTAGSAGSPATGGAPGAGGASGAGATTPPEPPPHTSCTTNEDCPPDHSCVYSPCPDCAEDQWPEQGVCGRAHGRECEPNEFFPYCSNGTLLFWEFGGERPPDCQRSGCPLGEGHVNGICTRMDGPEPDYACMPMCLFYDDSERYDCVENPLIGINEECSRDHARLFAALSLAVYCAGSRIEWMGCANPDPDFTDALEETVSCLVGYIDRAVSCEQIVIGNSGCFRSTYQEDAPLDVSEFLELAGERITFAVTELGGGGGDDSPSQCGTDCDCGRCSYCERSGGVGTCRYGGEGPYGCYRGCQ